MVIHLEIYLAAKQLEQEGIDTYSQADLQKKIEEMFDDTRNGIATHIHSICNASAPKNNTVVYNYLTRVSSGRYRLYREGDEIHPSRVGALTKPTFEQLAYNHEYWPLWADRDDEAPVLFTRFTEENFALFETEQKRFSAGDPISEKFRNKWIEWEQFIQKVVSKTGFKFKFTSEQWQNSGNLSNERYWSRLKVKGKDNYATCIPLIIYKDRITISLGYYVYMDQKGKAADNMSQFNSWIEFLDEKTVPQSEWNDYYIWVAGKYEDRVSLTDYLADPSIKAKLLKKIEDGSGQYLDFGKSISKAKVLELGERVVDEAASVVEKVYPLYKEVVKKSQDNMYLIGSSTMLHKEIGMYQDFIQQNGALMYWWSYVIREEYRTYLQKQLPFTLYIYGVTENGKRAITHQMKIVNYFLYLGTKDRKALIQI